MIYRVGDGDNPAYDYSSQLKPAKNAEGQEKFSLDRQKEQDVPKKKEEKGEDKKLHQKPGVNIKTQGGVKLELSGSRVSGPEPKADRAAKTQNAGDGLFDTYFLFLRVCSRRWETFSIRSGMIRRQKRFPKT